MYPKRITVHCSANRKGRYLTAAELRKYHTDPEPVGKGWSDIGYHFVIRTDGATEKGRPLTRQGAGVGGHNKDNVHICLVGGLDANGKPSFTYSSAQMNALYGLIMDLCNEYQIPLTLVCGHRDYSPDLNGDGNITEDEWIKVCPCFDVRSWLKGLCEHNGVTYE
ncbi:N-acetylmuramoyl-L-alanine amidase [Vibrio phage vB_VnaS-AQKL99]|nr:N-acetylmuramoyl-L-alanine amidase [Vibrio phage vB_VnaS-AQKL99]